MQDFTIVNDTHVIPKEVFGMDHHQKQLLYHQKVGQPAKCLGEINQHNPLGEHGSSLPHPK